MSPLGLDWRQHLAEEETRAFHTKGIPAGREVRSPAWVDSVAEEEPRPERLRPRKRPDARSGQATGAGLMLAALLAIGMVARRAWAPDPVRLNLHLAEHVAEYRAIRAGFWAGTAGCGELARSYAAADDARMQAVVGLVRLDDKVAPVYRAEFGRLSAEMGQVDRHFDSTGCLRPP